LPGGDEHREDRSMADVELVVTDLDGTFWDARSKVGPAVIAAVAELERRGMPLLVATGRRLTTTRDPLAVAGLQPPAIVLNGAMGVDLATSDRFHLAPFPRDGALAAYDAFTSVGLSPVVYVDHPRYDVFLGRSPDTSTRHVRDLGDTAGRRWGADDASSVLELRQTVADERVLGFSMIGVPFERAEAAYAALMGVAEAHLDRSIDHPGFAAMTVAPLGQSKWDGVLAFCEHRGLDPSKVMAIADGPNDLELLANAAVRVVPKVAHPDVLALATTVIASAEDGGWAEVPSLLD
jgi:hydroxymethylpyrimidine pyrophosphatase-like HAD family hydrolase